MESETNSEKQSQALAAARAKQLAGLLDTAFRVPGTRMRVGWDALIGLVPVLGDALGVALSSYIIYLAARSGAPGRIRVRMGINVALDFLLGLVPVVGDFIDLASRANVRNLHLLEAWLKSKQQPAELPADHTIEPDGTWGWPRIVGLLLVAVGLLAGAAMLYQRWQAGL